MFRRIPARPEKPARYRLHGTVDGVEACLLVSGNDTVTAGSAIDCDIVLADPLVPAKAFRMRRLRDHADPGADCDTYWLIEASSSARLSVNGSLIRKARLRFGDDIAVGCHELRFESAREEETRDRRANTRVDDLCARLIRDLALPAGYLEGCPEYQHRRRMQRALSTVGALTLVLLIAWLLVPKRERFEQIQPPLEIVMIAEPSLPIDAVRSLASVQRKTIDTNVSQPQATLAEQTPQSAPAMEMKPLDTPDIAPAKPAPVMPQIARNTLADLPTLDVPRDSAAPAKVDAPVAKLAASAQPRRLSLREAADPVMRKELGDFRVAMASSSTEACAINQWSQPVTGMVAKPASPAIADNRAARLAALDRYAPSPLGTEERNGVQIPVARMPQALAALDAPAATTGQPEVTLDGTVTEQETAAMWKSGQFHAHLPNSPMANPATYCFVGKTVRNGKPHLYISFICHDPNTDQLVLNHGNGTSELCLDDSIEIFLDTKYCKREYLHMIINARGNMWANITHNSGNGHYNHGPAWDVTPELKAVIDKQGGKWTCEIVIPFEQVGGLPGKGARWGVNFCRSFRGQSGRDEQLQTWFSVYNKERNFHNPELFGIFEW